MTCPQRETSGVNIMVFPEYRIEREQPLRGGLLPPNSLGELYSDRSLAVAVAIKSLKDPTRDQIRVIHIPTGEVVFQTAPVESDD